MRTCAEREKDKKQKGSHLVKNIGPTKIPRNTHTTIVSAVGKGKKEVELNAQTQQVNIQESYIKNSSRIIWQFPLQMLHLPKSRNSDSSEQVQINPKSHF